MTEAKNEAACAARKDTTAKELKSSDIPPELIALLERLAEGKDPACCWIWPGELSAAGYARWRSRKGGKQKRLRVSRVMCARRDGIVPRGMLIRHTCDNPACWNPDHLLQGTRFDNAQDMVSRGRHGWVGMTREERQARAWHTKREVHPMSRAVISPDGRSWSCARAADDALGLRYGTTWNRCTRGIAGWRWEDQPGRPAAQTISCAEIPHTGKYNLKAVRAPDGREWPSAADAGRDLGFDTSTIYMRCRRGTAGWRFA